MPKASALVPGSQLPARLRAQALRQSMKREILFASFLLPLSRVRDSYFFFAVSVLGSGTTELGCPAFVVESAARRIFAASIRTLSIAGALIVLSHLSRRTDCTGSVTSRY